MLLIGQQEEQLGFKSCASTVLKILLWGFCLVWTNLPKWLSAPSALFISKNLPHFCQLCLVLIVRLVTGRMPLRSENSVTG